MKKRLYRALRWTAALAWGVVAMSCAESGLEDGLGQEDEYLLSENIGLYTSVSETRAADIDEELLQSYDIDLYAYTSKNTTQKLSYSYDEGWRAASTNCTWGDVGFPTSFFAANNGEPLTLTNLSAESATLDFTMPTVTTDLIYFGTEVASLPLGGNIYADLEHALAKIHFSAETGGRSVYIASIKVKNIDNNATLTITSNNTATWSDATQSFDSDFAYELAATPTEATSLATDDNALMMIPQSTSAYEAIETDTDTYIEVIYYATDESGDPLVGYSSCEACANGDNGIDAAASSLGDDDPLYVKVGFPLTYNFEANKEYDISLGLGAEETTGGMILSSSYVDENGAEIAVVDLYGNDVAPNLPLGEYVVNEDGTVGLIVYGMPFSGSGTATDPYQITSAADFVKLADYNTKGVYFEVTTDLDFTDISGYTPFKFSGYLDGDSHSITNLKSIGYAEDETSGAGYIGLFSIVGSYATVTSLTLDYSTCRYYFSGTIPSNNPVYIGSFAGVNYGTIEYCNAGEDDTATSGLSLSFNSPDEGTTIYMGNIAGAMYGNNNPGISNCKAYTYMIVGWNLCSGNMGGIVGKVDSTNATVKDNIGQIALGNTWGNVALSSNAVGDDTDCTIIGFNDGSDTNACSYRTDISGYF